MSAYQFALSDENGSCNLFTNLSPATNSILCPQKTNTFIDDHTINKGVIQVDANTLDTFCSENKIKAIDILKLDVQGAELKVLKGAVNLLKQKSINLIYCEIWFLSTYVEQPLYHEIATYLESFGYFLFALYNIHFNNTGHYLWGDAIFYKQELL